jgi:hypothetical protein
VAAGDHSNHADVIAVSVLVLREVCGRALEMWSRERKWEMVVLWSMANLVLISSCDDDCKDRRFRANAISTLAGSSRLSIVPVLAFAMLELDADKDG